KYLDQCVKDMGGLTRKWVSPGRDGVPDRIVVVAGVVYFVEVKTLDGVLSAAQEREHERLRLAGANVATVWGSDSVDAFTGHLRRLVWLSKEGLAKC
ncbi:PDDEXK family nuclease, partial [Porticoccus sp.]